MKKNGKYCSKKRTGMKPLAILLALTLLLGCAVGGTLAWLTAKTDDVQNVFTTSGIEAGLEETGTTENKKEFKMIPGWTITKDPKAWVTETSEDCYLFIEVVEAGGVVKYKPAGSQTEVTTKWSDFLEYSIAAGWIKLSGEGPGNGTSVYYRIYEADDAENTNKKGVDNKYSILTNDQVKVLDSVTKEMMDAITADATKRPTLSFTAYAVQLDKDNTTEFSASEAWAVINPDADQGGSTD